MQNPGTRIIFKYLKPDVNAIDEAGRLPVPIFCVPLAAFTTCRGPLLSGDFNRLNPQIFFDWLRRVLNECNVFSHGPCWLLRGFQHSQHWYVPCPRTPGNFDQVRGWTLRPKTCQPNFYWKDGMINACQSPRFVCFNIGNTRCQYQNITLPLLHVAWYTSNVRRSSLA